MTRSILTLAIAASLAIAAPQVLAQAKKPVAASQSMVGTPSKLVLDNSTRVLSTLEKRRAEFTKNRGALRAFINSEFNQMFDRDYAARLVLGRHARGASDADVKLFSDALADNLMSRYGSSLLDFNTSLRVRVKSETALPGNRGVRVSTEMLRPIDDSTDRINADVRYQGKHWFAQLGYFASIYDTKAAGFQFDNPFNAAVAGGDAGRMSLEPDNLYNEVAVSFGWFGLPWNTAVTLSAAIDAYGQGPAGFVSPGRPPGRPLRAAQPCKFRRKPFVN